jgi:hypothetical protein
MQMKHCVLPSMWLMVCCLFARPSLSAQSAEGSNKPVPKTPVLNSQQKRGYQLLESARGSLEGTSYGVRVYLELRLASGYQGFNPTLSMKLLKRAFSDTLGIADENEKIQMQSEALVSLLRFGPQAVESLLPKAEPAAREEPVRRILEAYVAKGKYEDAVTMLLEQSSVFQEFPYGLATPLMLHLPTAKSTDRQMLFSLALASYKDHSHEQLIVGGEDFSRMVVRFWQGLPPQLVLEAVEEILRQAKDAQPGTISFSSPKGSAGFSSIYDARLFELLPTIEELDPSLAERLLSEDAALKDPLQQYPKGLVNLDPTIRNTPLGQGESSQLSESVQLTQQGQPGDAQPPPSGLNFESSAREIADESETVGTASISKALNLPIQAGSLYPRADALEGIAEACLVNSPVVASHALSELDKAIEDIPPLRRAEFLLSEIDALLRMGDKTGALEKLKAMTKVTEQIYKDDADPDDPNDAAKPFWPSAAIWTKTLPIALRISNDTAMSMIAGIPDPEIQIIEKIELADLYLGRPQRSIFIAVKKKNRQSLRTLAQ